MKKFFKIYALVFIGLLPPGAIAQTLSLQKLISSAQWDSLFPRRAGTYGTHPQGYTTDFYSYKNLQQAMQDMTDYFVVIRTKKGVWGELITITRKSTLKTYTYSNVESWWFANTTPETMVIVDFERFLNESSQQNNKRELAAFLAHISKETTGGWQLPVGGGSPGDYAKWGLYFVHEVGYTKSNSAGTYSQSHAEYPPDSSVGYYGRGPIQLSWNYNYGQFSKFIYHDKNVLLKYPDSIQESGVLAFKSAIWFWMMPQCPKPSCHQVMHDQWLHDSAYSSSKMYTKGFAHTNNIINGGLECRSYSSSAFTQKVVLRSKLYQYYMGIMGFNSAQIAAEDSFGYSTLCFESSTKAMEDYQNCRITPSYRGSFGIDSQMVCGSLKWIDGKTYLQNTKTAFHNIPRGDKNGNDSLVILYLTLKPQTASIDSIVVCQPFLWRDGKTYTSSTDSVIFRISGGAKNGCDSLIRLKLTVLSPPVSIDTQVACVPFIWRDGKTYDASNDSAIFRMKGGAFNGCDSLIKLHFTPLNPTYSTDVQSSCSAITWIDGKTYEQSHDSATFVLKGASGNGCDSIVRLKFNRLYETHGTDWVKSCTPITWLDGKTYNTSTDTARFRMAGGAAHGCDSIVTLNFTLLPMAIGKDKQHSCIPFKWIDGKTYTMSTDSAQHLIKGAASNGCDSLVILNLTMNTFDVSITQDSFVLSASDQGDSYQWVDCEKNFTPIAGENKRQFTAKSKGSYAVIVTQNECTDTSDCVEVTFLGELKSVITPRINVYPNPWHDDLILELADPGSVPFVVTDVNGQKITTGTLHQGIQTISMRHVSPGIYFLIGPGWAIKLMKAGENF